MPTPRGKKSGPTDVTATVHADKRVNIPTDELRDFMAEAEREPSVAEYERVITEPELVWRNKSDEDLEVSTVPIYIQEKVDPRALVENMRQTAASGEIEPELTLFDEFDGLTDFDLVEFYEHEGNWSNRLILGDSLLVMNSLAEKEHMRGKVQMIYVDPPYGIKFGSNWQVSTRKRDTKDGKAEDATRQPEQIKAFRDTWELGINSYLSYLRDRLTVAHELLTETGSVFVQIGDENVHLVRSLLDEVFGSANFAANISFRTKAPLGTTLLPHIYDHLLWYAKDVSQLKFRRLFRQRTLGGDSQFSWLELADGSRRKMNAAEKEDQGNWPEGSRAFRLSDLVSSGRTESCVFEFEMDGRKFFPGGGKSWKTNQEGMERLIAAGRVSAPSNTPNYVFFADDFPMSQLDNVWSDTQGASDRTYVVQTSTKVVERCMLMATDPGDLVLDPTCGAGTTAFVAEQWGRRWITIDTSRVALALARTRLMSARYPYYLLADTEDGATASAKAVGAAAPSGMTYGSDVRKGFVYRQIPHVTLGSVAQNPEVKPGMNRSEINEAIVRNADLEVLVDSPIEDRKRVRVSGRFTVEGLSPHRTLEDNTPSESKESTAPGFEATILDNLRRAGIQNTYKGERLKFDRLDPWAGTWLQAEGAFTDADGVARRVAVAIGPEHGTVSPDLVKDAAREALRGQGFDLLIVLGFAFDARASETTKEFEPASDGFTVAADERTMGRLRVLLARMNNDLAMGDEFLKKTGSGNLFMVFGEPDVDIRPLGDGNIEVEVRGVDVYDPTTGVVRSASTSDIACWFIDTNYDEQSFFVRHAYFTGDKEPFKKLKQALRSEISEDAWLSLYSTTSRPFAAPTTGKIAVKVINHYGDEVMQVYEL